MTNAEKGNIIDIQTGRPCFSVTKKERGIKMTISLAIDILIAFICLIIIIRNAARGFIKSFMTFAKTILAFLVAYIFNSPLAKLLSEKIFLNLLQFGYFCGIITYICLEYCLFYQIERKENL